MDGISKLEHCPECLSAEMKNYVHVETGKDMEIFVECIKCEKLVARYTLKMYASDRHYESFLRLMHKRRMSSGSATKKSLENFEEELTEGYRQVKESIDSAIQKKHMEDILGEME